MASVACRSVLRGCRVEMFTSVCYVRVRMESYRRTVLCERKQGPGGGHLRVSCAVCKGRHVARSRGASAGFRSSRNTQIFFTMPKKGKKKDKEADDWEDEADAIALENLVIAKQPGEALDLLFADLIAQKRATEADCDRATDELAAGTKTEEQLIAEWEQRRAPEFDQSYGFADGGSGGTSEKASKKKPATTNKERRWRQDEGGSRGGYEGAAVVCASLPDLDEATDAEVSKRHAELFGAAAGAPGAIDVTYDGLTERERLGASEVSLHEWRRAATGAPKALPLPAMTGVR